ncbi:MAG: hypothetical protein M3Y34_00535, partial [Actinomycetota bacterium]|nr:hypothetical protein [Actinomycetota bacterium]
MRRGGSGVQGRRLMCLLLPAAAALAVLATPASALPFTVNDPGDGADAAAGDAVCDVDSGTTGDQCTLRGALMEANALAGPDDVAFDLPGAGAHTLSPETALPGITGPVSINGYTQPGSQENTLGIRQGDNAKLKVTLSGHDLSEASVHGLTIESGGAGTAIRGLVINRFTGAGILVKGQATIAGNFIGTDRSGMKPRGNTFDGIFGFGGSTTVVGGPAPADRNVISDNGDSAITTNANMTVQGNYVGTASDGKSPLGNHFVFHEHAVGFTFDGILGGPGDAANVIAFNDGSGVGTLNTGTVPMSRN